MFIWHFSFFQFDSIKGAEIVWYFKKEKKKKLWEYAYVNSSCHTYLRTHWWKAYTPVEVNMPTSIFINVNDSSQNKTGNLSLIQ